MGDALVPAPAVGSRPLVPLLKGGDEGRAFRDPVEVRGFQAFGGAVPVQVGCRCRRGERLIAPQRGDLGRVLPGTRRLGARDV